MQNWYMYDKPDINKLTEVIELAEKNNHILDFGYYRLVEYFKMVGDIEKKKNIKNYMTNKIEDEKYESK